MTSTPRATTASSAGKYIAGYSADPPLSPRRNSWVAQIHTPTAGLATPRKSGAKSSGWLTKAHEARLQWEERNRKLAEEERYHNEQRRAERHARDDEHASRGRLRASEDATRMDTIHNEVEQGKQENREVGSQLKHQLSAQRHRALEARKRLHNLTIVQGLTRHALCLRP